MDRHYDRMHATEIKQESILNYTVGTKLSRYEIVLRGFVKEVCIAGRPLNIVNDLGMSDLTGNISVTPEALDSAIESYFQRGKKNLINEMDGKLFCLKVDCATRYRRSFLGMSFLLFCPIF